MQVQDAGKSSARFGGWKEQCEFRRLESASHVPDAGKISVPGRSGCWKELVDRVARMLESVGPEARIECAEG